MELYGPGSFTGDFMWERFRLATYLYIILFYDDGPNSAVLIQMKLQLQSGQTIKLHIMCVEQLGTLIDVKYY